MINDSTEESSCWTGRRNHLELDNGHIWQKAEYDYNYAYHPDVPICEATSACRMNVEDEDETIIVSRIK